MQIQDLHCLLRQGMSCLARDGLSGTRFTQFEAKGFADKLDFPSPVRCYVRIGQEDKIVSTWRVHLDTFTVYKDGHMIVFQLS